MAGDMRSRVRDTLVVFGILLLIATGSTTSTSGHDTDALWVAMYPYVPRLGQMEEALSRAWAARHPNVTLNFFDDTEWDGGYNTPVPAKADLFVFDAIHFNYYKAHGWLLPLSSTEVEDQDDYLPYSIAEPVKVSDKFYSIPLLGCTDILFYRKGDQPLTKATTFSAVFETLGTCTFSSIEPPSNQSGLMLDLAGKTTNACAYISSTQRITGDWPVKQPFEENQLFRPAIDNMHKMLEMSSFLNGPSSIDDPPYVRATWFSQGSGRALVAFTESMSAMSADTLESQVEFKVMPLSDNNNRSLFYSDLIAINAKKTYSREKRALVVELANLLASTEVMVKGTGNDGSGMPQYLMPTRRSVFESLGKDFPIYGRMQTLVDNSNPILFALDNNSMSWVSSMASTIRCLAQTNFSCGCDFDAGKLCSQQDADKRCPSLCKNYGGWTGAWVTTTLGQSNCGCRACGPPNCPLEHQNPRLKYASDGAYSSSLVTGFLTSSSNCSR